MKELFLQQPSIEIFKYLILATVVFIIANVIAGTANGVHEVGFDFTILRDSLIKYALIILVGVLMFIGGVFVDEILGDFVTDYINIKNLVSLGMATYTWDRAKDVIQNWITLTNIKSRPEED